LIPIVSQNHRSRGIGNLVGNRRRVTLGGLVNAQVIELHPEIQVLAALEADRRAAGLATRGRRKHVADDEVAASDLREETVFISSARISDEAPDFRPDMSGTSSARP
jgi:hypothetical protein